jgi:hypothetical protein
MSNVIVGLAAVVVVFFLVILLGLQIQITGLTRRIDEVLDKLNKEAG